MFSSVMLLHFFCFAAFLIYSWRKHSEWNHLNKSCPRSFSDITLIALNKLDHHWDNRRSWYAKLKIGQSVCGTRFILSFFYSHILATALFKVDFIPSLVFSWPRQNTFLLLSGAVTWGVNSNMLTVLPNMRLWEIWSLLKSKKKTQNCDATALVIYSKRICLWESMQSSLGVISPKSLSFSLSHTHTRLIQLSVVIQVSVLIVSFF